MTEVLGKGALRLGRYESFFVFLMLAPSIKDLNKSVAKAFGAVTILLLASFFLFFGLFSYPSITEDYSVLYELVRMVSYGRFIQRIESLFLLIWLIDTFLYFSLALALSILTIKKLLGVQYEKRIIPSVAMIIISCSLLITSHTDVILSRKFLLEFLCPAIFLVSLLIEIIANFKKRKLQKREVLREIS